MVVFGLGGIGLNVIQGARMVGADKIIGVDINPAKVAMAQEVRHDRLHQPEGCRQRQGGAGDRQDLTGGGADFSFDCTGNVNVMRQALECLPSRLGRPASSSAWRRRARRSPRARSSSSPAASGSGTAFGGARGRTDVPKIVDWYMEGKINIDDLITHTMPLDEINTAFDLMHEGKSIRSGGDLLMEIR